MKRISVLFVIVLAWLFLASLVMIAKAQQPVQCAPLVDALQILRERHQEVPRYAGQLDNGPAIMVTVSPSRTFTVLFVNPNGMACLAASGQEWTETKTHEISR